MIYFRSQISLNLNSCVQDSSSFGIKYLYSKFRRTWTEHSIPFVPRWLNFWGWLGPEMKPFGMTSVFFFSPHLFLVPQKAPQARRSSGSLVPLAHLETERPSDELSFTESHIIQKVTLKSMASLLWIHEIRKLHDPFFFFSFLLWTCLTTKMCIWLPK